MEFVIIVEKRSLGVVSGTSVTAVMEFTILRVGSVSCDDDGMLLRIKDGRTALRLGPM